MIIPALASILQHAYLIDVCSEEQPKAVVGVKSTFKYSDKCPVV